ncbi:MAG TPA: PP2C family serine/threonine-protein phosphatase [Ktedonobacterales bacterium]
MALRLIAASKTDVGKLREQNEDSVFARVGADDQAGSGIFVVSDGMGGYQAGEVASHLTVVGISEHLAHLLDPRETQPTIPLEPDKSRGKKDKRDKKARVDPVKTKPLADSNGSKTQRLTETPELLHYSESLREAIEHGNDRIREYAREHPDAKDLGATVTAALVIQGKAYVANVGDSRTYLVRDGKLQKLTRDHSFVARLVETGQIEPDDVYDHPNRNFIYRSLGAGKSDVEVDIFTEDLQPGDVLVLCSDGTWEMVRDPEIEQIVSHTDDLSKACEKLVDLANDHGGEDNISVVLVRAVASQGH